ncbi:hypothetical protein [Maricaulis sp.]|uniref:hypothetical protein n=1 Tax=Maricaulis sp. TaxID=1486257 RepID=UPI001B2CD1DE|nr:hypothetical protein [Maricaulis sp.]MBO6766039.1 hypothetical protein [Maricaulis sp.]
MRTDLASGARAGEITERRDGVKLAAFILQPVLFGYCSCYIGVKLAAVHSRGEF